MSDPLAVEAVSRTGSPPDFALGGFGMWVGRSSWSGWLDVAVRVGDNYRVLAEQSGPMLQWQALAAFEQQLRDLAEGRTREASLRSPQDSLTLAVTQSEYGGQPRAEVGLRYNWFTQKISFPFNPDWYRGALNGLRDILGRLEADLRERRPPIPILTDVDPRIVHPARWQAGRFEPTDYPEDALRTLREGVVTLEFVVTEEGEPSEITVCRSSGSDSFDDAARHILAERFRFRPATDAEGRQLPQRLRRKIAWTMDRGTPVVREAGEVDLEYVVDGFGWYSVEVRAGACHSGFGGSSIGADMADVLLAATAMANGEPHAGFLCNAEPGLTRVEFDAFRIGLGSTACRLRIQEIDHCTGEPGEIDLEAWCESPLAVAEAVFLMARPHFERNVRGDHDRLTELAEAINAGRAAESGISR